MIYNSTEQDSSPAVTEYKDKPSWSETLSAATKNFTSVSLTTSASNYYYEERDKTVNDWKKQDPSNEYLYDTIGSMTKQELDKLEALYEDGRYDAVRGFMGNRSRRDAKEGEASKGTAFLAFKKLQEQNGFTSPSEIRDRAEQKSYNDYMESGKILAESDYTSAKLLGTMGGALQDPITLMTLPLGTWKTGGSILMNASRAFGEEALIEAGAQAVILPTTYAYKQEIGIKTTLKDEAYNAVASIISAGLLRGTGSAAFDLTAKGIKALKVKDPELGAEYETLAKGQATESLDEHIDTLHKAEFNEEAELTITNPNEKGIELSKSEPIPEVEPAYVARAQSETYTKQPIESLNTERVQKYVGDRKGADHTELDLQLQKIEGDYEGPAIRAMLDTEGTLSKLQVGDVYETRGVTSIAKDKGTADLFAKEEFQGRTGEKIYVTFDSFTNKPVNIGQGNKIGFDSMLDSPTPNAKGTYIEDEVLIPSGRSFEVVKKEKIGDETHITVRETSKEDITTYKNIHKNKEVVKISESAREKARKISQDLGFPDYIEDVYIVGSRATGKDKASSDLDILVKTKTYEDIKKSADSTAIDEAMDIEFSKMPQKIKINGKEVKVDYFLTDEFYNDGVIKIKSKPDPREMKIYSGEDEAGNPMYKTHKELQDEIDMDDAWIQKAKDCFL